MNDPSEIPEEFRPIANEISAEEFARLKRLQDVMKWSTEHEILCTGRPGLLECPNPPFTILVLHGSAFAIPCIDCVDVVVRALFRAGHGSCRQVPLSDSKPENLKPFALHRRKVNKEAGKFVIPPSHDRRHPR